MKKGQLPPKIKRITKHRSHIDADAGKIGNPPESAPFFVEDTPSPLWKRSPWASAVESLLFGEVEQMAQLLERGEPIPPELAKILALALRKDSKIPFRLELTFNPKPGKKRSGRPSGRHTYRDIYLAAQVRKNIDAGLSYDKAVKEIATGGVGESLVRQAYTKYKDMAPDWLEWGKELARIKQQITSMPTPLEVAPPEPPIAKWMLNGDR